MKQIEKLILLELKKQLLEQSDVDVTDQSTDTDFESDSNNPPNETNPNNSDNRDLYQLEIQQKLYQKKLEDTIKLLNNLLKGVINASKKALEKLKDEDDDGIKDRIKSITTQAVDAGNQFNVFSKRYFKKSLSDFANFSLQGITSPYKTDQDAFKVSEDSIKIGNVTITLKDFLTTYPDAITWQKDYKRVSKKENLEIKTFADLMFLPPLKETKPNDTSTPAEKFSFAIRSFGNDKSILKNFLKLKTIHTGGCYLFIDFYIFAFSQYFKNVADTKFLVQYGQGQIKGDVISPEGEDALIYDKFNLDTADSNDQQEASKIKKALQTIKDDRKIIGPSLTLEIINRIIVLCVKQKLGGDNVQDKPEAIIKLAVHKHQHEDNIDEKLGYSDLKGGDILFR